MPQGTLFTEDFLNEGIRETAAWRNLPPGTPPVFRDALLPIFASVADPSRLNEAQTEERIVKPILHALGWGGCYWVQERLDRKRTAAERYPFAIAIADAKAWSVDLDRRGAGAGADETPSGQILRYLSRAEVQSGGGQPQVFGSLSKDRERRCSLSGNPRLTRTLPAHAPQAATLPRRRAP
jgi:hypothetical protein